MPVGSAGPKGALAQLTLPWQGSGRGKEKGLQCSPSAAAGRWLAHKSCSWASSAALLSAFGWGTAASEDGVWFKTGQQLYRAGLWEEWGEKERAFLSLRWQSPKGNVGLSHPGRRSAVPSPPSMAVRSHFWTGVWK